MTEHIPVMLKEVVEALNIQPGKTYVDCTFGRGGYSKAILEGGGRVIAIDQDPSVEKYAEELKNQYREMFSFHRGNFAEAIQILEGKQVDGLALDLGVSSMQLDQTERGFSFMRDAALDMRMSSSGYSAADFVNEADEFELARVIFEYGDERASRKIARFIVEAREDGPISTTLQLASIVRRAVGFRPGKIDSATKTFQAIRIWVNDEMGSLERLLEQAESLLNNQGRLVVVTFHSLEDTIVKRYLQSKTEKRVQRSKYAKKEESDAPFELVYKKALKPSDGEVRSNPRSRSAKMRAAKRMCNRNGVNL
jgi:16S rRNA (cytosine1402-N4)-methyltransferase